MKILKMRGQGALLCSYMFGEGGGWIPMAAAALAPLSGQMEAASISDNLLPSPVLHSLCPQQAPLPAVVRDLMGGDPEPHA